MFLFVSGAVRSGKSEWAEKTALELSPSGPRAYLATARAADAEMRDRVARHQAARATRGFITVERERDLERALPEIPPGATVLLECLGTWTANEMFGRPDGRVLEPGRVIAVVEGVVRALRSRAEHLLIVSNDVFSDGVVYDEGTENYLKALGSLHIALARSADCAVECASGLVRFARPLTGAAFPQSAYI